MEKIQIYEEVEEKVKQRAELLDNQYNILKDEKERLISQQDNLLELVSGLKKLNREKIIFLQKQIDELNKFAKKVINFETPLIEEIFFNSEDEFKNTRLYKYNDSNN